MRGPEDWEGLREGGGLSPKGAASVAGSTDAEKRAALDAASRGDLDMVSAYFPGHFKEYEEVARQALHKAANFGNLDVVVYLIEEAEVDKDAIDRASRKAAIHYACEKGKLEVVEYLVKTARVDLNMTDKEGLTPLDAAICFGQKEVARVVVQHLLETAASNADEGHKLTLEKALQERDWATREAVKERLAKEAAVAAAEEEAGRKQEVLKQLAAEVSRRQEAEARAQEMSEELKALAGMVAAQEEAAAAKAKRDEALRPRSNTSTGSSSSHKAVTSVADAAGPVEEPSHHKVEEGGDALRLASSATALPVGTEVAVSTASEATVIAKPPPPPGHEVGLVERLKAQLEKERRSREESEMEKDALLAKLEEAQSALASEVSKREQAEAALDAGVKSRTGPLVTDVVTGFVQKHKHSLGRDSWESRFLVVADGKLRYFHSDKDYLLANSSGKKSPRPGSSSSSSKVFELKLCVAAPLPSDDLVFVVRHKDGPEAESAASSGPASPTSSGGAHGLCLKCPDTQAREAWLQSLQANGCTINDVGLIASSGPGRPVSMRLVASDSISTRPSFA